jgi:hypothetical protein
VWSTNDRFVFGSAGESSGVYQQTVGGERQLLFKTEGPENPTSTSPDGRILLRVMARRASGIVRRLRVRLVVH